jgi:DNA polymerase III epsilon subunit-like protein
MSAANKIKTFVFFDCETTGLAPDKPRITELSLVATKSDDINELHKRIKTNIKTRLGTDPQQGGGVTIDNIELLTPRVVNKLTICVYPMKTVYPTVSHITGLDNYNLEGQAIFDNNTSTLIDNFLNRLEKPACLLAHNGTKSIFYLIFSI